jgi:hypothetical protein
MKMPTPWPSLETPEVLRPLLVWSRELLWSPRQRESDAGEDGAEEIEAAGERRR